MKHALAREKCLHDFMHKVDVRIEQALHPLLLKQLPSHRWIPLDLHPSIRHFSYLMV
jgi:hypothetical protein